MSPLVLPLQNGGDGIQQAGDNKHADGSRVLQIVAGELGQKDAE